MYVWYTDRKTTFDLCVNLICINVSPEIFKSKVVRVKTELNVEGQQVLLWDYRPTR